MKDTQAFNFGFSAITILFISIILLVISITKNILFFNFLSGFGFALVFTLIVILVKGYEKS